MFKQDERDGWEDQPARKPGDIEPGRYRMVEAALGAPPAKESKAQALKYQPQSSSRSRRELDI